MAYRPGLLQHIALVMNMTCKRLDQEDATVSMNLQLVDLQL